MDSSHCWLTKWILPFTIMTQFIFEFRYDILAENRQMLHWICSSLQNCSKHQSIMTLRGLKARWCCFISWKMCVCLHSFLSQSYFHLKDLLWRTASLFSEDLRMLSIHSISRCSSPSHSEVVVTILHWTLGNQLEPAVNSIIGLLPLFVLLPQPRGFSFGPKHVDWQSHAPLSWAEYWKHYLKSEHVLIVLLALISKSCCELST